MRPKLLAEEHVEEEQSIKRSDYLSDNEQRVTTESDLLGDLFQKYVSYFFFFLPQVFNEE
jgi:hypothetical protein